MSFPQIPYQIGHGPAGCSYDFRVSLGGVQFDNLPVPGPVFSGSNLVDLYVSGGSVSTFEHPPGISPDEFTAMYSGVNIGYTVVYESTPIPEAFSFSLFGVGLLGLGFLNRCRGVGKASHSTPM